MDLGLKGKCVVISGGTRGIGAAIANEYINEGAIVSVCARNSDKGFEKLKVWPNKKNLLFTQCDVNDFGAVRQWIEKSVELLGGIDILVSNVSAQSSDWVRSCETDLVACSNLVESVLPYLLKGGQSSIVAIASQAALRAVPSFRSYSAVKAGLISYMGSLGRELLPRGIRVNCVSPSEVEFPGGFWERMRTEDPKLVKQTLARHPSGRFGTPEEVARVVVFVSSPAASYLSGNNILVDLGSRDHIQF